MPPPNFVDFRRLREQRIDRLPSLKRRTISWTVFVSAARTLNRSQRVHTEALPEATVRAAASNWRFTTTTRLAAAVALDRQLDKLSAHVEASCNVFPSQVAAQAYGFVTTRTPPAAIAATKFAMFFISPKFTQKSAPSPWSVPFPFALTDDARCEAPSSLLRFHSVNVNELCSRQPRERSGAPNGPMRRKHESSIYKISRRRNCKIVCCGRSGGAVFH